MADAVDEARALLDQWSLETWGARPRAGAGLAIREVDPAGPLQVVLRSRYEKRWVELQHRATGDPGSALGQRTRTPLPPCPAIDPWAAHADGPRDGSTWTAERKLSGSEVIVDCPECTGQGKAPCRRCDGTGFRSQGESQQTSCDQCTGRGEARCQLCDASGRTSVTPIVRIQCGTAEQVAVVEDDELPLPVYLALQQATAGPIAYREESPLRMEPRLGGGSAGGGAYRGETIRHSIKINEAVNRLVTEDPLDGDIRIHGQELTVTRVPAFRIDRTSGQRLWIFGNPPQLWPPNALRTPLWWARRSAPWAAAIAGLGTAVAVGLAAIL